MGKKNVMFLEHCVDNTVGGSHYCLLEICQQFENSDYNCIVVFYQDNALVQEFRDAGATVVIMPPPWASRRESSASPSLISRLFASAWSRFDILALRRVQWARLLRRHQVDVLHLNNTFSHDIDSILGARLAGIPVVSHVRGINFSASPQAVRLAGTLDAIIAISEAVRNRIREFGVNMERVRLIFDGISPERMSRADRSVDIRGKHGIPADATLVGLVGNVKQWKGQEVLAQAFSQIAKKHAKAYCLFVGAIAEESYHQRIVEFLDDAGLSERVKFVGYQREVGAYLGQFDVFVHSSIEPEPFGIVILEAMSLEIPVIATSIGAPREIVEDGRSGLLFDPSKPEDLAGAIDKLLTSDELRKDIGARGRQRFLGKFTNELNANAIARTYEDILRP